VFKDAIKRLKESGRIPKFNRAIAEGVGYTQAKDGIHQRVNTILKRELTHDRESNPRLPEGLAYLGYRFMSPFEAYVFKIHRQDSRNGKGRSAIPIASTDTYMISAMFRLPGGYKVNRPLYLPFIRRGGLMNYWGTSYHVAPVIHQPGICREHGGLFVNFDFTRKVSLKNCRRSVKILVNGRKEELYLPGTLNLYSAKNPTGHDADEKPLVYWLFGKYGFREAIKRYTGVDVEIIPAYKIPEMDLQNNVVISSGADPKVSRTIQYALKLPMSAFPNMDKPRWEQDEHILLVMCGAFFKAAHHYATKQNARGGPSASLSPLFSRLDEFAQEEDLENLNSPEIWKEILGRSIMGTKTSDVDLHRSMTTHFIECGRYVNDTFRGELMVNDPDVDPDMDMFDFLMYTTKLMIRTRLTRQDDIPSMYGKRLTVVDYLLLGPQGFTSTISSIRWKLEGLDNKSPASCADTIRDNLNKKVSFNLVTRNITANGAISFFNAASESMVLAVSTHAISQTETDAKNKKSGKTVNLNDRTKHASASHAELGNIYYIPKSSPYKYGILNPYMKTSRTLVMERNPKLDPAIRKAEEDLAKIGR